MSKDLCCHSGVRDESHSCLACETSQFTERNRPTSIMCRKCGDQRLLFGASPMDLSAGSVKTAQKMECGKSPGKVSSVRTHT